MPPTHETISTATMSNHLLSTCTDASSPTFPAHRLALLWPSLPGPCVSFPFDDRSHEAGISKNGGKSDPVRRH